MPISETVGTYTLGDRTVKRLGYGAMQLAGPGVFGPPKDHDAALAVLREAIAQGVDHIDTSDFYGPHVTNRLIREALHPYPDDLVIVTKIGARRDDDGRLAAGLLARGAEAGGARQPEQSRASRRWMWSICGS
jgi:pyridoxine 4-dehydrogenase